jgi:hypothetical protein
MSAAPEARVCVVVKLRDLDTDARALYEHEVTPPRDTGEQRAKLVEVVARHKPEAEIRSFANHAASFVDSEHLVVAYFKDPAEIKKALKAANHQHDQRELFSTPAAEEAA